MVLRLVRWASLVICLALVFVPTLVLIYFARPLGDDYCFAGNARHMGFFGALHYQYFHWQGRWFGSALSFLTYSIFNLQKCYRPGLYLILFLLVLIPIRLMGLLFPKLSLWTRVVFSLCMLGFYFAQMPEQFQVLYWLTGAIENHLTILLLILAMTFIFPGQSTATMGWTSIVSFGLIFAVLVGGHELYGLICTIVLAAGTYVLFQVRSPSRLLWAGCTIGGMVGLAVVILAPGNAVRMAALPQHGKIGPTIRATVADVTVLKDAVNSAGLVLATALFLRHPQVSGTRPDWLILRLKRPMTFAIVVFVACVACLMVAPAWAQGAVAPGRALDASFLIFLLGWFVCAVIAHAVLCGDRAMPAPSAQVTTLLTVLFCVTLLAGPYTGRSVNDAVRYARTYARQMDARTSELAITTEKDPIVAAIPIPSSYDATGDISTDPSDWRNVGVAGYFHLHSVRLTAPLAAPGKPAGATGPTEAPGSAVASPPNPG
jgi:hypothetical protein